MEPNTRSTDVDFLDAIIAHHSKSFALAARLLPPAARAQALALYAYCRRADDAVDLAHEGEAGAALDGLRAELAALYRGDAVNDPIATAFQRVVHERRIPRQYVEELLLGFEMDVRGQRYTNLSELLRYCHRVAGTVGLMMCHVMGVRDERALVHAAHLGIAMQLTNICRDVREDFDRGRVYLPLALTPTAEFPEGAVAPVVRMIRDLLALADRYYASADAGLRYLSPRCALAVRAARLIYARIGRELEQRGCDPRAGRAVVSRATKLLLALRACAWTALGLLRRPIGPVAIPMTQLPSEAVEIPFGQLDILTAADAAKRGGLREPLAR